MKQEYRYYDPRKVIENGKQIYEGGAWARFLKRRPKVDEGKILIGILAPSDGTTVGAVEISDEKVLEDFSNDYGSTWFCLGGVAFLYTLPKERADECRSDDGVGKFKSGELEKLLKKHKTKCKNNQ